MVARTTGFILTSRYQSRKERCPQIPDVLPYISRSTSNHKNIGLIKLVLKIEKNMRLQEQEFMSNVLGHKAVGREEMKFSRFLPRAYWRTPRHTTFFIAYTVEQFLDTITTLISKLYL